MSRRSIPALLSFALAAAALVWVVMLNRQNPARSGAVAEPGESGVTKAAVLLAELSPRPDWSRLDAYQMTITRERFLELLENVFTVSAAWQQVIEVGETSAWIQMEHPHMGYRLHFAAPAAASPEPPRYWEAAADLAPASPDRPLTGVRIAIDPGHIGGDFAKLEERWFRIGDGLPVTEGDMTLRVAKLLKPRLEALGAEVLLVRETAEPVTEALPETFLEMARTEAAAPGSGKAEIQLLAERLFYRTSEIRARARRVNETLKPDLVLCLHFNAEGWGPDPDHPVLSSNNHFHTLVNGAYTDAEVRLPDQRFEMVLKILQRSHREEVALAEAVVDRFVAATELPPYLYEAGSSRALNIGGNPYIWARNLLANRLYECPVVFLEPYVMNSTEVHARVQAGDYEGLREIGGRMLPSIYREYADAVTAGLRQHYLTSRPMHPNVPTE